MFVCPSVSSHLHHLIFIPSLDDDLLAEVSSVLVWGLVTFWQVRMLTSSWRRRGESPSCWWPGGGGTWLGDCHDPGKLRRVRGQDSARRWSDLHWRRGPGGESGSTSSIEISCWDSRSLELVVEKLMESWHWSRTSGRSRRQCRVCQDQSRSTSWSCTWIQKSDVSQSSLFLLRLFLIVGIIMLIHILGSASVWPPSSKFLFRIRIWFKFIFKWVAWSGAVQPWSGGRGDRGGTVQCWDLTGLRPHDCPAVLVVQSLNGPWIILAVSRCLCFSWNQSLDAGTVFTVAVSGSAWLELHSINGNCIVVHKTTRKITKVCAR